MTKNLTKHDIRVRRQSASKNGSADVVILPSGVEARCAVTSKKIGEVDGVPVSLSVLGDVVGLPEPEEEVTYVTSIVVAQKAAAMGRRDVVSPDTGPTAVRVNGQVVAVRGFQTFTSGQQDDLLVLKKIIRAGFQDIHGWIIQPDATNSEELAVWDRIFGKEETR